MLRVTRPVLCLLLLLAVRVAAQDARPDAAQVEFFEKQVRPLLAENCQQCHGPDKQKGGLRLDSRQALLKGGDSGPAVTPGNPDASRLIKAIHHDTSPKMPPRGKLPADQIAVLTAWVKMGTPWPDVSTELRPPDLASGFKITARDRSFWSFQPIEQPPLPAVQDRGWPRSRLDHFILAPLEENGLHPVAAADKRTLIRRATFDLVGLPPTPEEIDAFMSDPSPDAYERLIDRLLASPRYGERWGRHWLDLARYGEDQAHTFEARKYPDGFRYRDWVVRALNDDMPYDRFVMEQIAGDLLEDGDRASRLAATGLFALGPVYYGRAVADELDDRIDTLSRALLGLTVACARCHEHKIDPNCQADYYALAGIFASTEYREYVLNVEGGVDQTTQEPNDKNKDKNKPRKPAIHALTEGKPANAKINIRGNPNNLGPEVPRRFLAVLSPESPPAFTQGSGRLELARAIASKDNPLTARVLVNRVWMHHFGRGLVGTPSNFGALGERPTHPELLDDLAARFMAHGWSLKWLHREIMLSATYRLASQHDTANAAVDPDNRLLWRMNRRRLEVEPWRDALLAVAGTLDATLGGPPGDLAAADNRRRTLYGAISRHNLDPVLRLFDFPDPNLTSDRRAVTIVPLQQLFVLNSDFMLKQAKALAARLTADPNEDNASRIQRAFRLVYGRPAGERERELGLKFLAGAGPTAWERYAQVLLSANEFTFID